jgi:hypothetical protein
MVRLGRIPMSIENLNRLAFAGPADPANGFPMWFEDGTGLQLELVTDADPRAPAIADLQTPGAPVSFPDNYPDEAFYFMAEAQLAVGGAGVEGRARVILAIEAAFGGVGLPDPDARVVFARLRVRMDDVKPGQKYVITHPYGVIDDPLLTADDNGRFFHTFDLGIVENDCTAVLRSGQVAPFLQWDAGAPVGYIGDGVTDHKVIGSPFGTNFVRIEGPGIREGGGTPDPADPGNMDKVWTDLFSIQGRIAKQLGVEPRSITVGSTGAGFRVSAQAQSAPLQQLELVGDGFRIDLTGDDRDYSGIADLAAFPVNLKLVNRTDRPPTVVPVVPTDAVYIESAQYDVAAGSLTIAARSSNSAAVLTVAATGALVDASPKVFAGLGACPAELVITSSLGGTGRQMVELVGVPGANLGVAAGAAATMTTRVGVETILDGTGSRLATAFQWTQTGGAAVVLTDDATAKAKFTPTATGPLQFTLTVQGPGGPDSVTVDVTVDAALPPDVIVVEQAEYRTSKRQFRVGGTISNVPNVAIVSFSGTEIGRSQPDVTGAWSVRYDVPEGDPVPTNGDTLTVNSNSGTAMSSIIIRN